MHNRNKILAAGALCSALALFSSAYAEGDVGIRTEDMPRFRAYVTQLAPPSYTYSSSLVVGAELPAQGMTFYEMPAEYNMPQYRYTVVNQRPVLVDPGSRKVIQIIGE